MKKRGFTLVELLAIIVILAVILVIAVPKINNYIVSSKKQTFINNALNIVRQLEYDNMGFMTFQKAYLKDFELKGINKNDINVENSLVYVQNNEIYIDLVGKGAYEGFYICSVVSSTKNVVVQDTACGTSADGLIYIDFEVDLDGGISNQTFNEKYVSGNYLILQIPTKGESTFTGWKVVNGDSILSGNRIKFGTEATIVKALWKTNPTLTLKLDGGAISQSFESGYKAGTTLTLTNPTKEGYTFAGWELVSGNSIISGNNLTMGSEDTILKATWTINTYKINYNLDGGTPGISAPTSGTYGSTVTVSNPSKTGYTFNGWTVVGISAEMNDTSLTIGSSNITLMANWTPNTYTINYNLDSGTFENDMPTEATYGSTIVLENPIKEWYIFTGWTVSGNNAILSGNNLTIGDGNITMTATWRLQTSKEKIEAMLEETPDDNGLFIDDTVDKNIRYHGATPKNYIMFNNELWRIIGLFKVKTSSGNTEKLMKIIRNDSLGVRMSWDSSASSVNGGKGINEWSQADLKSMLNTYYIRSSSTCRYCTAMSQSSCSSDCSSKINQLGSDSINMIETVVWNTGGFALSNSLSALAAYNAERGTGTGKKCSGSLCNDSVTRTTTWTGKVALIYPSDYGYASTNASCLSSIATDGTNACQINNWLSTSYTYWFLSPGVDSTEACNAWYTYKGRHAYLLSGYFAAQDGETVDTRPAVYLKSNVYITDGNGTIDSPYLVNQVS